MESVRCARAMGRRIGQWMNDLQLLDDRAGPPVQDDERQRILMLRTNVDEMNVEAVDLGDEVREGLQPLLALAPVVLFRPIARERLHRREPRALGLIFDGLLFGPLCRRDAPPKVVEVLFRHVDLEGAYLRMGHGVLGHGGLLSVNCTSRELHISRPCNGCSILSGGGLVYATYVPAISGQLAQRRHTVGS